MKDYRFLSDQISRIYKLCLVIHCYCSSLRRCVHTCFISSEWSWNKHFFHTAICLCYSFLDKISTTRVTQYNLIIEIKNFVSSKKKAHSAKSSFEQFSSKQIAFYVIRMTILTYRLFHCRLEVRCFHLLPLKTR